MEGNPGVDKRIIEVHFCWLRSTQLFLLYPLECVLMFSSLFKCKRLQVLFVSLALSMYFTPCGQIIAYYFINGWTVYKTSDMVAKTTIFNFKSCFLLWQNNVSALNQPMLRAKQVFIMFVYINCCILSLTNSNNVPKTNLKWIPKFVVSCIS